MMQLEGWSCVLRGDLTLTYLKELVASLFVHGLGECAVILCTYLKLLVSGNDL